jgi:FkbM family methyltransferase
MDNREKLVGRTLRDTISLRLWAAKQVQSKATLRLWYAKQVWKGERELRVVHSLSDPNRITLDIGSNRGLYAIAALRFSKRVVAFEPQPYFASFLRRYMPAGVEVRECAVSDTVGTATLLVPTDRRFHAEARLSLPAMNMNMAPNFVPVAVPTTRLDDAIRDYVGLIKIDVEGHELAVLNGANNLIDSSRPNVIIEVENRHRAGAVSDAFQWFRARQYRGYCLRDNRLLPTEGTGEELHVRPYNFIFLPSERQPTMQASTLAALSAMLTL